MLRNRISLQSLSQLSSLGSRFAPSHHPGLRININSRPICVANAPLSMGSLTVVRRILDEDPSLLLFFRNWRLIISLDKFPLENVLVTLGSPVLAWGDLSARLFFIFLSNKEEEKVNSSREKGSN